MSIKRMITSLDWLINFIINKLIFEQERDKKATSESIDEYKKNNINKLEFRLTQMIEEMNRCQLKVKELEDQLNLTQRDSQRVNLLQQELNLLKAKFADDQNAHQNEIIDTRQIFNAFLANKIVILI